LIGISFIIVSLLSTGLLYITSVNYLNYTETATTIPQNIAISDVHIPLILDESQDQTVQVFFHIANPSDLTIYVTNIEASIYMDNISDTRSFPEKMNDILVGIAQFNLQKSEAYVVRPGESITVPANLTVSGGSVFMSRLNTLSEGKYHPFIFGTMWYTFEDVDLIEVVGGVSLIAGAGIDPR
jgi:hypothetical protein